jgi:outer membrane lipoprotein SlyB
MLEAFMKHSLLFSSLLVITLTTSSCATWDKLDKTERGAVIGTGAGATIGAGVGGGTGAILGGIGGGVAGGVIGHETEEHDKRH